jgi:hypothetical protein
VFKKLALKKNYKKDRELDRDPIIPYICLFVPTIISIISIIFIIFTISIISIIFIISVIFIIFIIGL